MSWLFRLLCLRLAQEEDDGKHMARHLIKLMWHDVEERIDQLGVSYN